MPCEDGPQMPAEAAACNDEVAAAAAPDLQREMARCRTEIAAVEALLTGGAIDSHTTYFETVAAMAFWLFRELKVQTAVRMGSGRKWGMVVTLFPATRSVDTWVVHTLSL